MEANGWLIAVMALAVVALLSLPGWVALLRQPQARRDATYAASVESTLTSQQARWEALARRVDAQDEEIDALKEERLEMRGEIAELLHGVEKLIAQLEGAHLVPVWRPRVAKAKTGPLLAGWLAEAFSVEELDSLAFDVGIGKETFRGETVEARARELVERARRLGKMGELERRAGELRPGN